MPELYMPIPDDQSFKLFDWLWTLLLPLVGVIWKQQGDKMEALKLEYDAKLQTVTEETNRNRDVAAKIFDKLDQMSRESSERHVSLLTVIHAGLDRKVDK